MEKGEKEKGEGRKDFFKYQITNPKNQTQVLRNAGIVE